MSNENPVPEEKKRATRANQRVSHGTGSRKSNTGLWIALGIGFLAAAAVIGFMFMK